MIDYTAQFLTIAGLHLLAVASPGPDLAIVLRQSITHGRSVALRTSAGIGAGILVHTTYSLLGIGLLLKSSVLAFTVMKFAAAAYLGWLGWKALQAKPAALDLQTEAVAGAGSSSEPPSRPPAAGLPAPVGRRSAFWVGFMTNALNPKATLFFLSVFSVVIDPHTPRLVQLGYGLWMAVMTGVWFSLVSLFFTQEAVRRSFLRLGHWFERAMGALLIALGLRLAFTTLR